MKLQSGVQQRARRERTLKRLKVQLEKGTKPKTIKVSSSYAYDIKQALITNGFEEDQKYEWVGHGEICLAINLSDKDKNRISKEIETLKARV